MSQRAHPWKISALDDLERGDQLAAENRCRDPKHDTVASERTSGRVPINDRNRFHAPDRDDRVAVDAELRLGRGEHRCPFAQPVAPILDPLLVDEPAR